MSYSLKVEGIFPTPGSCLRQDFQIEVEFNQPVDPRSAFSGFINLSGIPGTLSLNRLNTCLYWRPKSPPKEKGELSFLLQGIATSGREQKLEKQEITYKILPGPFEPREIPEGYSIINRSRTSLRDLGAQHNLFKLFHEKKDEVIELAFDDEGKPVEWKELLEQDEAAHAEKYGLIHPELYEQLKVTASDEVLGTMIWLNVDPQEKLNKAALEEKYGTSGKVPREVAAARKKTMTQAKRLRDQVLRQLKIEGRELFETVPAFVAEISPEQIRKLSTMEEVAGLYLDDDEPINDLLGCMADANADDVVNTQGWRATNIRVGVWEKTPDDTSNLDIEEFFDGTHSLQHWHPRAVTGIIKNVLGGTPNGFAPDSLIYSANKYDLEACEWAVVGKHCRVMNQSFHRVSEAHSGDLSRDDIFKDYLAIHFPYPTIVQAAGNFWQGDSDNVQPPEDEFVNHKTFNCLTVGNHIDGATAMVGSSVFRNPNSPHNGRELPEIAANGHELTSVGITSTGTSFSSPAVAGSVALLQNMHNSLLWWPEGCRAILLAGASRNVRGNTWWNDVIGTNDAWDGTGALDVNASGQIAQNRVNRNNTPVPRGWNVGSLTNGNFSGSSIPANFVYRVRTPEQEGEYRVKVALAWDSVVKTKKKPKKRKYISSRLEHDFDLQIRDSNNNVVAWSASWDNSYEIAEVISGPNQTYTIHIRRFKGTENVWYGLAFASHRL